MCFSRRSNEEDNPNPLEASGLASFDVTSEGSFSNDMLKQPAKLSPYMNKKIGKSLLAITTNLVLGILEFVFSKLLNLPKMSNKSMKFKKCLISF